MRAAWGWLWPVALGVAVAYGIMHWIISFAIVPSSSMYPTIPNPCYILVDHVATEVGSIQRGEVVLFPFPDDHSKIFVKRVIGLPGETITIHNGKVFVDGKVLNEPYLGTLVTQGTYGPYVVPANDYFMLGDNRNISEDSRFWHHTFVPRSTIMGRADYVLWPLYKAKPIH